MSENTERNNEERRQVRRGPYQAALEALVQLRRKAPELLKFPLKLPKLTGITDIGGRGIKRQWPKETVRLMKASPRHGMFVTGIENSDPVVSGSRRNQLREAHDFYANFRERLENIKGLGITWLRFGEGYSQVHLGPGMYNWDLTDRVLVECERLGIAVIADLLHFGLPDWLHEKHPETPYFQNPDFSKYFAEFAGAFAKRYPHIRYYTPVNEPFITAAFSAKYGFWNEARHSAWQDDRDFVRASFHIAQAIILARESITDVWLRDHRPGEPVFMQNESFEKALVEPGSNREQEAQYHNLRRFVPLDLAFGRRDPTMQLYLQEQGLAEAEYEWCMEQGSARSTILGIDHYPGCIQLFGVDRSVRYSFDDAYLLEDVIAEYWERYPLPLLHAEVNDRGENAVKICQRTYEILSDLRAKGYPILGMSWFGDELQVGWQSALVGPEGFDEYPVGLFHKGSPQPVGKVFQSISQQGFRRRFWPRK